MKHFVTLFFALFTFFSATAQVTSIGNINIGLSGLVGSSTHAEQNNYGMPELTYVPTLSYSGGLTFNINWVSSVGFQMEVNYSRLGQEYNATLNRGFVEKTVALNYLQVPLLAKYTFTDYSLSLTAPNIYVVGGVSLAYLLNVTLDYSIDGSPVTFEEMNQNNNIAVLHPEFTDVSELFSNFDAGLIAGLGIELPLSDYVFLSAESRIQVGLTDVNDRDWRFPDLRNNYSATKNYALSLKAGLQFIIY